MLGHRNLKTTQHYARILDLKIAEDMRVLKYKASIRYRQLSMVLPFLKCYR